MGLYKSIRLLPNEQVRHQTPQPVTPRLVVPNVDRVVWCRTAVRLIGHARHLVNDGILASGNLQNIDQAPQSNQTEICWVGAGKIFVV